MTDVYHHGNRELQETFRDEPMANRLAETIIQAAISFLSMGNILVNSRVGLLFVAWRQ